jgi:hypothetical protein
MERGSASKELKSSWQKRAPLWQADMIDQAGLDVPHQKAGNWYRRGTHITWSDQGNPN